MHETAITRLGRAFMHAAITATTLTHIPAEDLGSALRTLEKQRNLELIFLSEDVKGLRTHGADGKLTVEETLQALLRGTGLTYRYSSPNSVTIVPSHNDHPV